MYVYIHVHIFIYTHPYTHTHTELQIKREYLNQSFRIDRVFPCFYLRLV